MSIFDRNSFYYPYPKSIPKGLIYSLIIACLLLGLSGLSHAEGWQGWLAVFENWVLMLVVFPSATALIASPFKFRDSSFELKNAYYLGMFVAFLFILSKLRYWH